MAKMLCTYIAILLIVILQSIPINGVSEMQDLENNNALETNSDAKDGDQNQSLTPKSLWGNKRSRSKTQKYDLSRTATSDLVTQKLKVNASGKKPFKRNKIKVVSVIHVQLYLSPWLLLYHISSSDPKKN